MDADHALSMHVTEHDGICTLVLKGELDMASAPGLRERLLDLFAGGVRQVVIDLAELTYVESVGLGVLVGALKRYRAAAGDLQLRGPRGQVSEVLELTSLAQVFRVEP